MNCHIVALTVCFSFLTAWFQNGCINDTTHVPTKYSFIGMVLSPIPAEKKADGRSRVDRDADNHQLLQLEEKDVVSTVATALSDICGPGEWMPMEKLHAVVSIVTFIACIYGHCPLLIPSK